MRMELVLAGLLAIVGLANTAILLHDEDMAAREALHFARTAFVKGDLGEAYALLPDKTRRDLSVDQFEDTIRSLHPSGFPRSVIASEFEMVPGQELMNIFLLGENADEKFYYRILMEGTSATGYKVVGFLRSKKVYPPSRLRHSLRLRDW